MDAAALQSLSLALDTGALAFARIGACLTVMPALGGARVAVRARLFFAFAFAALAAPVLPPTPLPERPPLLLLAFGVEMAVGGTLGLLVQAHYAALRFAGGTIAASIGFQPLGGAVVDGGEPDGALGALLSLGALMVLFAADAHHLVLRAVVGTYDAWPPGTGPAPPLALVSLVDALRTAWGTALSLAAPFLVYGLMVQSLLGLVNKLAPAVPLYFVGLPVLIAGGLALFALGVPDLLHVHLDRLPVTLGN